MLNNIIIQGRLVADPELRQTPGGTAVANCRIACDRDFKDKATGEKKADFINVVAWRGTAEFLVKHFAKGRMIIVEGRIQNTEYTDKEGVRHISHEVVADNLYFSDSKITNTETVTAKLNQMAAPQYAAPATPSDYAPRQPQQYQQTQQSFYPPVAPGFESLVDDGNLPF